MRYKTALLIAYEGTDFSGWQIQPNGLSIQEQLENVLRILLRHQTRVIGSGRTDAGVHAIGQVAHFNHEQPFDPKRLLHSLNGLLPPTIRVREVAPAPSDFHAQHGATGKIYHYFIGLGRIADPLRRRFRTQIHYPVDVTLLKEAAQLFVGRHDFTSFSNRPHEGSAAKNGVRTMRRLDVMDEEGGIRLEFEADGFLYKMVRNIVGTLLDVGSGRRPMTDIPQLFAAKDRRRVGMAALPRGLFLIQVFYPDNLFAASGVDSSIKLSK